MTAPMVAAFKRIFTMSTFQASLVQFAYYGAYFALALPAAFINQWFGYKIGLLTGLGLASLVWMPWGLPDCGGKWRRLAVTTTSA
jgi:MFS transporter, FHS family, L-fucose permease